MSTTESPKNYNVLTAPKRWLVRTLLGDRILQGPFAGMRYLTDCVGSAYWPKWFGTYESELIPTIEEICRRPFSTVVDVGAAEGYYAVGLARRLPSARVVAFEAQDAGRRLLARMAALNQVDTRLEIRGFCDRSALSCALRGDGVHLVVMDAEGAENELLDPVAVPELAAAEILVELHGEAIHDEGAALSNRFADTHRSYSFRSQERTAANLPPRLWWFRWILPPHVVARAIKERPAPQAWLHLLPQAE